MKLKAHLEHLARIGSIQLLAKRRERRVARTPILDLSKWALAHWLLRKLRLKRRGDSWSPVGQGVL